MNISGSVDQDLWCTVTISNIDYYGYLRGWAGNSSRTKTIALNNFGYVQPYSGSYEFSFDVSFYQGQTIIIRAALYDASTYEGTPTRNAEDTLDISSGGGGGGQDPGEDDEEIIDIDCTISTGAIDCTVELTGFSAVHHFAVVLYRKSYSTSQPSDTPNSSQNVYDDSGTVTFNDLPADNYRIWVYVYATTNGSAIAREVYPSSNSWMTVEGYSIGTITLDDPPFSDLYSSGYAIICNINLSGFTRVNKYVIGLYRSSDTQNAYKSQTINSTNFSQQVTFTRLPSDEYRIWVWVYDTNHQTTSLTGESTNWFSVPSTGVETPEVVSVTVSATQDGKGIYVTASIKNFSGRVSFQVYGIGDGDSPLNTQNNDNFSSGDEAVNSNATLWPGKTGTFIVYVYLYESTSSSAVASGKSEKIVLGARPKKFTWTNKIEKDQPIINLTASDWTALQENINAVRKYKNLTSYEYFATVGPGTEIKATYYNQMVDALSVFTNTGITLTKKKGASTGSSTPDTIIATDIDKLRQKINAVE